MKHYVRILAPSIFPVLFVLAHPFAVLPYLLASSYTSIVLASVVTKESAEAFGNHPIGTGPYKSARSFRHAPLV